MIFFTLAQDNSKTGIHHCSDITAAYVQNIPSARLQTGRQPIWSWINKLFSRSSARSWFRLEPVIRMLIAVGTDALWGDNCWCRVSTDGYSAVHYHRPLLAFWQIYAMIAHTYRARHYGWETAQAEYKKSLAVLSPYNDILDTFAIA